MDEFLRNGCPDMEYNHGIGGGLCGFMAYGVAIDVPELGTRAHWLAT